MRWTDSGVQAESGFWRRYGNPPGYQDRCGDRGHGPEHGAQSQGSRRGHEKTNRKDLCNCGEHWKSPRTARVHDLRGQERYHRARFFGGGEKASKISGFPCRGGSKASTRAEQFLLAREVIARPWYLLQAGYGLAMRRRTAESRGQRLRSFRYNEFQIIGFAHCWAR
jgi:hypothetical protein